MEQTNREGFEKSIRVRFAPSPTGFLHIGGARTALYNWLFARGNGGVFILRIEDTDIKRSEEGYVQQILNDMRWLGLDWDEGPEKGGPFGPYFQSQRKDHYGSYCTRLIATGKAYYCFCKPEELEERRKQAEQAKITFRYDGRCKHLSPEEVERRLITEPAVVRFKVPEEGFTEFIDLIRKKVSVSNKELDDFIILRSDGTPTYNFTVVADDIEMRISHVIRGDDHISNTPKQLLIYKGLDEKLPEYAHIPMILGKDGARLSKRHGATAISAYREMGYLPEAMVNYLALLGWSYDDKQTLFTMDDLIKKFSLKHVGKRSAIFDEQKLLWMNGVYIRDLDIERLVKECRPFLEEKYGLCFSEESELRKVLGLIQGRMKYLVDAVDMTSYFWKDEIDYLPDALEMLRDDPLVGKVLESLQVRFSMLQLFTIETLEEICKGLAEELGIKLGAVAHPLRAAVTGRKASPGLFEILELLGKERTIFRIKKALQFIEQQKNAPSKS